MATLGRYTLMLFVSIILYLIQKYFECNYIDLYLVQNSLSISLMIFTVFMSLTGILVTQLYILKQKLPIDMKCLSKAIHKSTIEYICILLVIFLESNLFTSNKFISLYAYAKDYLVIILIWMLIIQLWIMYDFVNAICQAFENS